MKMRWKWRPVGNPVDGSMDLTFARERRLKWFWILLLLLFFVSFGQDFTAAPGGSEVKRGNYSYSFAHIQGHACMMMQAKVFFPCNFLSGVRHHHHHLLSVVRDEAFAKCHDQCFWLCLRGRRPSYWMLSLFFFFIIMLMITPVLKSR